MTKNDGTYLVIAGLGFVFTIIGYFQRTKKKHLNKSGVKAEGVVFSVESDNGFSIGFGSQFNRGTNYIPVIRFVTAEKEWVTKRYDAGGLLGSYKEGDKVTVIYNPENINEFVLDDSTTTAVGYFFWLGILMIAAGGALFAIGA